MHRFIEHDRQSLRLPSYDYSSSGAYFVTICTREREELFGRIRDGEMILNEKGLIVRRIWDELPIHYPNIGLDEFVVMPNHFHGIIWIHNVGAPLAGAPPLAGAQPMMNAQGVQIGWAGARPAPTLGDIVGGFKSMTTVAYIRWQKTRDPNAVVPKLWQRNYHDRIIRTENELFGARRYIRDNPMKWELERNPDLV